MDFFHGWLVISVGWLYGTPQSASGPEQNEAMPEHPARWHITDRGREKEALDSGFASLGEGCRETGG